jgi:PKHD-type hydroxylase
VILEIPNLLTPQDLAQLREIGARAKFLDGKLSNQGHDAKQNMQIDHGAADYATSSRVLAEALNRSREFRDFAMPKRVAAPMMTKYAPGMKYGAHADSAYLPLPDGPMRSDISVTVFLNEPSAYEGGELTIYLGEKPVQFKGPPASCVVYPSTTLHEVRPIRTGERLVGITFVESIVPDQFERAMIYELGEVSALEGLTMKPINRMRLEVVRNNLIRKWSG